MPGATFDCDFLLFEKKMIRFLHLDVTFDKERWRPYLFLWHRHLQRPIVLLYLCIECRFYCMPRVCVCDRVRRRETFLRGSDHFGTLLFFCRLMNGGGALAQRCDWCTSVSLAILVLAPRDGCNFNFERIPRVCRYHVAVGLGWVGLH